MLQVSSLTARRGRTCPIVVLVAAFARWTCPACEIAKRRCRCRIWRADRPSVAVKPCSRGGFSGSESSNPFPGLGEPPTFLEAALSVEFEYAFQLGRSPALSALARPARPLPRYLPPYSPDLNPIKRAFAKLKALLRKPAARTVESLWHALGDLLDRFTPQECANSWQTPNMLHSIGIGSRHLPKSGFGCLVPVSQKFRKSAWYPAGKLRVPVKWASLRSGTDGQ
jgi:transposase